MNTIEKAVAIGGALAALTGIVVLYETERPPMESIQRGYRGTGMEQIYNPRMLAKQVEANALPEATPPLPDSGQKASQAYQNVQVLKDVDASEFLRLMASITQWVSPEQGCNYCHNPENLAADTVYTKVVARRMLQMVQHVNSDWKAHVAGTGVTCYTCHRGQPVPSQIWYNSPAPPHALGLAQVPAGKNIATAVAGDTSLPYDPFTPFLQQAEDIRIQGHTALPSSNASSIKQTDWTYSLMMNFSQSLGVNCSYCHNTRSFGDWSQSSPQRVTAWHGIRMVRDLNNAYLAPLQPTLPPQRLGALGDAPKVNCATCHQGVYKPLFGASMVGDYPELQHP